MSPILCAGEAAFKCGGGATGHLRLDDCAVDLQSLFMCTLSPTDVFSGPYSGLLLNILLNFSLCILACALLRLPLTARHGGLSHPAHPLCTDVPFQRNFAHPLLLFQIVNSACQLSSRR